MRNKYLIYIIILIMLFLVIILFATQIQMWFMSKLAYILILVGTFIIGWLLGRFGRSSKSKN